MVRIIRFFPLMVGLFLLAMPAHAASTDCALLLTTLKQMPQPRPFRAFKDRYGKVLVLLNAYYPAVQKHRQALQNSLGQEIWISRLSGGRFAGENILSSVKYLQAVDYVVLAISGAIMGGGFYLGVDAVQSWMHHGDWATIAARFYAAPIAVELGALLGLAHLAERGNINDLITNMRDDEQVGAVIVPSKHLSKKAKEYLLKTLRLRGFTEITPPDKGQVAPAETPGQDRPQDQKQN